MYPTHPFQTHIKNMVTETTITIIVPQTKCTSVLLMIVIFLRPSPTLPYGREHQLDEDGFSNPKTIKQSTP